MLLGTWWPSINKKLERTISRKKFPSCMISFIYNFAYSFVSSPLSILLYTRGQLCFACDIFSPKWEIHLACDCSPMRWCGFLVLNCFVPGMKSMIKYEYCICRAHQCMSVVWLKHGFLNSPLLRFESTLPYSFVHLFALFYILLIVLTTFCTTQHPIDQPNLWYKHCGFQNSPLPPAWFKQTHCSNP